MWPSNWLIIAVVELLVFGGIAYGGYYFGQQACRLDAATDKQQLSAEQVQKTETQRGIDDTVTTSTSQKRQTITRIIEHEGPKQVVVVPADCRGVLDSLSVRHNAAVKELNGVLAPERLDAAAGNANTNPNKPNN